MAAGLPRFTRREDTRMFVSRTTRMKICQALARRSARTSLTVRSIRACNSSGSVSALRSLMSLHSAMENLSANRLLDKFRQIALSRTPGAEKSSQGQVGFPRDFDVPANGFFHRHLYK